MSPRSEGFWQRRDARRYLPVAIGVTAFGVLLLTLTLIPRRTPGYGARFAPRPPAAERATVTEETVPLRSGAGPRSPVLRQLARNTPVTLYAQTGLWCRVADASGAQGFVSCRSIERNSDRNARARRGETILKFEPLTGSVAATTPLLLAPFSFAPVWGEAQAGSAVEVYSVDHGFYAVKLPDESLGFLASADVDLIPGNPSEPALVPSRGKVVTGISVSETNTTATATPAPGAPSETPAPGPTPGGTVAIPPPGIPGESFSVAPAVLLEKVDPVYPPAALAAHLAGTVVLQISIDASGVVTRVDVKREAPMGMTEAAVEAVRGWRYRPATGPAGPIPSMKQVKVDFRPPA